MHLFRNNTCIWERKKTKIHRILNVSLVIMYMFNKSHSYGQIPDKPSAKAGMGLHCIAIGVFSHIPMNQNG